jgi:ABC-type transport system involved in multi-copper enzyme maturation permease subunit
MMAAFRGEMFKLIRRPAVWVCIGMLLLLALLIGYALLWLVFTHPPAGSTQGLPPGENLSDAKVALYPANLVKETLGMWGDLGGAFALILGVLVQGSEFGWGTIKTLYTQRSGRLAMLGGKVAALAVIVLVMVVGLFAVNAAGSIVVATIDGKSTSFPALDVIAKGVGACYLVFGFWALLGLSLATLFRQSAMAIGLGLAYGLIVERLVFGLLAGLGGNAIPSIQQWFPIANTTYLVQAFGPAVSLRVGTAVSTARAPFADANHAVVMLVLYLAAFTVISAWFSRTRDVTN